MGITFDYDSRKATHVPVLSWNYVKTGSIFHAQAKFQSSTHLHYLNKANISLQKCNPWQTLFMYLQLGIVDSSLIPSTMINVEISVTPKC